MVQELSQKAHLEATSAIAELLGLGGKNQADFMDEPASPKGGPAPVKLPVKDFEAFGAGNLPVAESAVLPPDKAGGNAALEGASVQEPLAAGQKTEISPAAGERVTERELEADVLAAAGRRAGFGRNKVLRALKFVVPYAIIFGIGVFVYYYFLGNYSFTASGLFGGQRASLPAADAKQKARALSQYEKDHLKEYYVWVNQFYFEVSDPKIIDPNTDTSASGLTNFQKFLLGLNPKAYDTLGTGLADGLALTQGLDPLTLKPLGPARAEIVDKYVDLEVVNNRLALDSFRRGPSLRGPGSKAGGGVSASDAAAASLFGGSAGLVTGGQNPAAKQNVAGTSIFTAPQTGVDFSGRAAGESRVAGESLYSQSALPKEENRLNLDKSKPGLLEISSLKIAAPLIWTKDTNDFLEDLGKGVVHYPGTPLPGDVGTSYISGHSSNFLWAKGRYKKVFAALGDLKIGDSFIISVTNMAGQNLRLHYVVFRRSEYAPNNQAQFLSTGESVVALSTCWPVGTTAERLVAFARLSQIEK